MKTEQEQIEEIVKIILDASKKCFDTDCDCCDDQYEKDCAQYRKAVALVQAGYGDISEYKAEREMLGSQIKVLKQRLNSERTMTLKEYVDKYSPFGFSDEELIIGFLKSRPDVLASTISTLCMMNYKSVLSLEHKVSVKDEYLNCLKDWAQGKIHKDGEFHPELRDKMVENIDRALGVKN